jgi:hypothetical protein
MVEVYSDRCMDSTSTVVFFEMLLVKEEPAAQWEWWLDELDDRGSIPGRGCNFFSLRHRVQNGSGSHPASYPMGTWGSFPGGKVAGHKADHSPSPSAEVKNEWSYTSTSEICLHGVVLS